MMTSKESAINRLQRDLELLSAALHDAKLGRVKNVGEAEQQQLVGQLEDRIASIRAKLNNGGDT